MTDLDDDAFVAEIQRRYGGIPPEVLRDAEMMALVLPGLRADIAALEAHPRRDDARITCPLTVFGGDADRRVPPAHLEAWRDAARGGFRLRIFPGDHFYLGPCRDALIADVAATLAPVIESAAMPPGAERRE